MRNLCVRIEQLLKALARLDYKLRFLHKTGHNYNGEVCHAKSQYCD